MARATAEEYKEMAGNFIHDIIDEDLASGKHTKIATRFPPEPNGYLHIGHAKSLCLNFGTALKYGGTCNLRYDDTNPVKEDMEYKIVGSTEASSLQGKISNESPVGVALLKAKVGSTITVETESGKFKYKVLSATK